jgi:PEP-CTERM motif-containing protein
MRLSSLALALGSILLTAAPAAFADTVTWADWNALNKAGVETGSIGGVNVTYTGEISFVNASNAGNFNYFQPTSTYVGGVVGNASTNGGMIAVTGAPGITDTFNFSTAVTGLVLSEVSLGQFGIGTNYTFNDGFSIVACGPNTVYGGGCVTESGNTLIGHEGDGTIVFGGGPITSLSFTAANPEFWNGFTIGLLPQESPVPEPGTLALVGTGILGLISAAKRKFA